MANSKGHEPIPELTEAEKEAKEKQQYNIVQNKLLKEQYQKVDLL